MIILLWNLLCEQGELMAEKRHHNTILVEQLSSALLVVHSCSLPVWKPKDRIGVEAFIGAQGFGCMIN
jgi:hypothetical protein